MLELNKIKLEGLIVWIAKKSNKMSIRIGKNNDLLVYPVHLPLTKQFKNIKYGDKVIIEISSHN